MGFLKNAITSGISEGISKGINGAVGAAVNKAVTPVADKWAGKVAQDIDQSIGAVDEAAGAAGEARRTIPAGSGFEHLSASLAQAQVAAQDYATEMSKNFKECPKCGETVPASNTFCPQCGAKLPEATMAESHVCKKCGTQNQIGTNFCQSCGAVLPHYEAEYEAERAEREAAAAAEAAEAARQAKLDEVKANANVLKNKAANISGAAADKALGAASSLLGKFIK